MRAIWAALLLVGLTTSALAVGYSLAGKPAFDPKSLRGTQEGPLTQILTLGSDHLAQRKIKPTPQQLGSLLDKLEAFRPEVITHEGLSGEQCDQLERYKARYPGVYDDYCWDTDAARKATGLSVPQAMAAAEETLAKWPAQPSAAERRRLASLFLASNDRLSALVQWLRLPESERKVGDGIDEPLLTILNQTAGRTNESIMIGVALAVRLKLDRVYAVDDHTSDSVQALAGPGFGPAIQQLWSTAGEVRSPAFDRFTEAEEQVGKTGDFLSYYRAVNDPETQRAFIEIDYGRAMKLKQPEFYGRQYVAWFEVRNLRMVASIRAAFGNKPGARVLNIVGASHKGYYDAYLDQMSDVQIVDVAKVLR